MAEASPLVLEAHPVYRGTEAFRRGEDRAARVRAVVEAQALRLRVSQNGAHGLRAEIRRRPDAAKLA